MVEADDRRPDPAPGLMELSVVLGGRAQDLVRVRTSPRAVPGLTLEEIEADCEIDFRADPLESVCVCFVRRGAMVQRHVGGRRSEYFPGDVVALPAPGLPLRGSLLHARVTLAFLDPGVLSVVAGDAGGSVRLMSDRPHEPAAGQHLRRAVSLIQQHSMTQQDGPTARPRASDAALMFAGSVLAAFPHTTGWMGRTDPRPPPLTVRKAVAFIEANAAAPVGVADIAEATGVSPRALQYAFQRHLATTPLTYLRLVRLSQVRSELCRPGRDTSVTQVAARWGFFHLGRFAAVYREVYGETPRQTMAHHASGTVPRRQSSSPSRT